MKTLKNFDFKNKLVLLRSDLNSDVVNGNVVLGERIKESSLTINYLRKKKARIVIISHQGRPGKSDFVSLKQHAKLLNKYTDVKFVKDTIGKIAESQINGLKAGNAILLENLRFLNLEFENKKNKLTLFFKNKIDIYINDAFSVSHRRQNSMAVIPKYINQKCAGLILERELAALKNLKTKNCLYILAGAKPKDNLKLIGRNKTLSAGLFGQVCVLNNGKKLGAQEKYLKKQKAFIKISKSKLKKVKTPLDFAVLIGKKRKEILLDSFPSKYEIFDIGQKTINEYKKEIKRANAIYLKGPLGDCSKKQFCKGTFEILKEISKNKGFTIIGGGHLSDAIKKSKINRKKFNHISLSGGALISYIAKERLPGLVVLE
jgi:phosphoglycerate kinase